jgi:phage shock protein A
MGIFTRMRDIISSNVNAMLDKAEDPEKLVRLMIQEMEDTLVEIKASCAGAMATKKKIERQLDQAEGRAEVWADRARLAVDKGRDDLAKEALLEKKRFEERVLSLEEELAHCEGLINQYQDDIMKLEEKLASVREKQRILVQRHIHARQKKRAESDLRKAGTTDAFVRFESFENRIERMEAEADLVNYGRKDSLEDEFSKLEGHESLEEELEKLKADTGKPKKAE